MNPPLAFTILIVWVWVLSFMCSIQAKRISSLEQRVDRLEKTMEAQKP